MVIRVDMGTLFADICIKNTQLLVRDRATPQNKLLQLILTRGTYLVAVVPNQFKDKASVHERHQVIQEKRQTNVHLFSLILFL